MPLPDIDIVVTPPIPVQVEITPGLPGPPGIKGATGEAGPPGTDKNYVFTQGVPSSTWTIEHNLGKYPSVLVEDSANDEVEGDIKYTDANNLVITFSAAFSGIAYLN